MKVCMFLLSFFLFTTLSIKRRSKIYPVANTGLEQAEITEAEGDDIINPKKHPVILTHTRTLYDTDDESVVSSKKRFLTYGIPAALLILILHKSFAAYQVKTLLCCLDRQPSRLFNKGSPGKIHTSGFFPFYLKNYLRLFPFLLFSTDSHFSFPTCEQPSLQNTGWHRVPSCNITSNYPLVPFFSQECRLSFQLRNKPIALKSSSVFSSLVFLLYDICLHISEYCPP